MGVGALAGLGLLAGRNAWALPAPSSGDPLVTGRGNLAIVNARIITLDQSRPMAEAALVRNGRIVALGSNRDVLAEAGRTQHYDAAGKTLIPGFIDHHCHVEDSCIGADHEAQLQGLTTPDAVIAKLREIAAQTPRGNWIIIQAPRGLYGPSGSTGRWITREEIDRATEAHPVMMLFGIHSAAMNTLAFRVTGYWDSDSPKQAVWKDGSPRLGSVTQRDAQGRPTGIITEIWDYRPGYTPAQYKASMRRHFQNWFTAKGLTTITTLQNESPNQFIALQELQQEGGLPVRLRASTIVPHAAALADITRIGWQTGFGDDMFRFGGVKFFVDGINGDGVGNTVDDIKWTREHLIATLTECQRGGLQVIMHAVAQKALELALDCTEAAQRAVPGELRHRIDHLSPQTDALIQRFKTLGVTSGITGRQVPVDPTNPLARGRTHRFRTMAEQGVALLVLDAAGPGGNYHPMRGIANAMATVTEGGNAAAGEALTFEQALKLWTIVPAHNSFEAHEKGSIEIGKFGDFAVLSDNPIGKSAKDIFGIDTVGTIVGGNVVYNRS
jgi:predicted amidohydrolase YtcJ